MDRQRSRSRTHPDSHSRRPTNASAAAPSGRKPRMPPIFNIIRLGIYATVFLWTIVCLAIAVHFNGLLAASDLTRFVPFAIFVCVTSMIVIFTLLAFSLRKEMNPITTRIELCCLALIGTFWLALGAFLATSEAELADVACYSSADSQTVLTNNAPFNTNTYHAQYHVLEAFSLFNVILIWSFLIVLLFLACRQHWKGEKHVWFSPVPTYAWFNNYDTKSFKLPKPVTFGNGRPRSRGRTQHKEYTGEKEYTGGKDYNGRYTRNNGGRATRSASRQQPNGTRPLWTTYNPPVPTHDPRGRTTAKGGLHSVDKYARGASPRR